MMHLGHYQSSLDMCQTLAEADSGDAEAQMDLAHSHFLLAALEETEQHAEAVRTIITQLRARGVQHEHLGVAEDFVREVLGESALD